MIEQMCLYRLGTTKCVYIGSSTTLKRWMTKHKVKDFKMGWEDKPRCIDVDG